MFRWAEDRCQSLFRSRRRTLRPPEASHLERPQGQERHHQVLSNENAVVAQAACTRLATGSLLAWPFYNNCLEAYTSSTFTDPSIAEKILLADCSKRLRGEARERSMSGGVLVLYVDATSVECNEAYEAFSVACDEKKKPNLELN